jgi:hypothetical protein
MTVFLVRHHSRDSFVGSDFHHPRIVRDVQQAYRFPTWDTAARCARRMTVPDAWTVVEATYQDGRITLPNTEVTQ